MSALQQIIFGTSSGPSGYYYKLSPSVQYYGVAFGGIQPITSGWLVSGSKGNDERFVMKLDTTGTLTSYKRSSNGSDVHIGTMSDRGYFSSGIHATTHNNVSVGFMDNDLNYVGYTGGVFNALGQPTPAGIDDASNTVFSTYYNTNNTKCYISSTNVSSGTSNWGRGWPIGTWSWPGKALIRAGDTSVVTLQIAFNDMSGFVRFNKSTGNLESAHYFSNSALGNTARSFISDSSGFLYLSSLNGQIVCANASNEVVWANTYFGIAGQNFGYIHMCLYDGFLYVFAAMHYNGSYLAKINPADGTAVWGTNISAPLYSGTGISVSANGIMITGNDDNSYGWQNAYLLNYPLDGGLFGTKGDFTFSNLNVSRMAFSTTLSSTTGPTLEQVSGTGPTSYGALLNTAPSIVGSKITFSA